MMTLTISLHLLIWLLPVRIKSASSAKPYLALLLELNLDEVRAAANKIRFGKIDKAKMRSHGIFTGKVDDRILGAALRLMQLFSAPEDVPALAPLITQEIFYYLLKSPEGKSIYEFVSAGGRYQKISESIATIRSGLSSEIDVETLAEQANMSRASFFKSFKDATSMSPIQYQKRLRLIEAKRLIVDTGESAEGAAFRVGYKSASQFSREYSRMFGKSPLRDAGKDIR